MVISPPPSRQLRIPRPMATWIEAFSSSKVLWKITPAREIGELLGTRASSPKREEPSSISRVFFTNSSPVLAFVFVTSSSKNKGWQKFYTYVPALLLCYFIPALLNYPLNLIAAEWFDEKVLDFATSLNISIPEGSNFNEVKKIFDDASTMLSADFI